MTLHPNFIGCDVSKDTLDLFDPSAREAKLPASRRVKCAAISEQ